MTKTPKLLPWFARKAGVSEERAGVLWRKAVRQATIDTGYVGNTEYWGEAMSNFIALLQAERSSLCTPSVTPFIRSQNRLWSLPLTAMEIFCGASARWQRQAMTRSPASRRAA